MCGAVPSSVTVPLILPSPAALTLWLRNSAPPETRITADNTVVNLFFIVMESSLLTELQSCRCCAMSFQPLLLAGWRVGVDRLQIELFRYLLGLARLFHESSKIEN